MTAAEAIGYPKKNKMKLYPYTMHNLLFFMPLNTPPMAQQIKNLPEIQETQEMQVQSLGQEDPLEKKMATHSSILA